METKEQNLPTWEECRRQTIELGKFSLIDNRWICHNSSLSKMFSKNSLLKNSCITYIKNLPENISNLEIIFHILWDKTEYANLKCPTC